MVWLRLRVLAGIPEKPLTYSGGKQLQISQFDFHIITYSHPAECSWLSVGFTVLTFLSPRNNGHYGEVDIPEGLKKLSIVVFSWMLGLCATASAQTFNARISGGGGSGKCTFEVVVDGVADVQIRYNQGYLQTKAGQQATWRRLDCNQPLPRNPTNFRFKGIDGRGKQYLLRDPNSNNGVAVIRIEDPKNGREGYTGDIMWSGGGNGNSNWGGGSNGWWNDNWNGGGNQNGGGAAIGATMQFPNCQRTIRNQVSSRYRNASVNFNGQPNQNKAGSFVMVDGRANVRASSGQSGNINYHCTMHPNGNVADSKFDVTSGNLPGTPQPR